MKYWKLFMPIKGWIRHIPSYRRRPELWPSVQVCSGQVNSEHNIYDLRENVRSRSRLGNNTLLYS